MIRMMGMIDLPAAGMNKSLYDEAVKQVESSLGLSEAGENEPHNNGDTWKTDSGRSKNGSWQKQENVVKTESRKVVESLLRSPRLKKIVKEEYNKILEDCEKAAPKIEKKLEELRSKMCEEFVLRERKGTFTEAAMEKRMQINVVAELLDMPVNELYLYFLNHVKTANEHKLVEYHLGHVYFYAN